jgi:opacity protein-like surface antigen
MQNALQQPSQKGETMKSLLAALAVGLFSATFCFAGPTQIVTEKAAPPISNPFGVGPYAAIDAGANVYNDIGSQGSPDFLLHTNPNTAGFAGAKAGYVFGSGTIRFAIEEDIFYNGFAANVNVIDRRNGQTLLHNSEGVDSVNFMTHAIARFSFSGLPQLQPYVGAGFGAYYAFNRANDLKLGNAMANKGIAWDVLAGADYYFTPKISTFVEYKFLDDVDININLNHNLGQHLVGAGVRYHF